METKLDQGDSFDYSEASKFTLGDLFKRYIKEGRHLKKKGLAIRRVSLWSIMHRYDSEHKLVEIVIKTLSGIS